MFNINRFGDGHATSEQNHFQVDMGVSTQIRAPQIKNIKKQNNKLFPTTMKQLPLGCFFIGGSYLRDTQMETIGKLP